MFFCLATLFGQGFGTGALFDPVRYEQTDAKPVLLTRNYTSLPRSVSLKQYSPIPESQGEYGTCVAWSTAFAARTISESIALNRLSREQSSNNAFSPAFLYKNASNDPTLYRGMYVGDALDFAKNTGLVKRSPLEKTTDLRYFLLSIYNSSIRYPIADYVRLFSNYLGATATIEDKVIPVKKSLSEKKPVLISMLVPDSFFSYDFVLWRPAQGESPSGGYSGHSMCVVGYDDNMNGGVFEIQNSWGADWGNEGYFWISYKDFADYVREAFEIIENLAIYMDAARYAASIEIEVYNDTRGMPVTYDRQGFYQTRWSFPSGTEFRFIMTNQYPAYVYAFSSDNSNWGTERIFPLRGISPVLDYTDSTIAWPGEYSWIRLDDTIGSDYLIVLYSKEALDIATIERRFASERGTFPERVSRAVGQNFIPYREVQYNGNRMEFSAVSTNPRAVFGLLLAINHHAR